MTVKYITNYLLIFIIISLIFGNLFATNNNGKLNIYKDINDIRLLFQSEYRHNKNHFSYRHYDFSARFKIDKGLFTSLNYRSAYEYDDESNKWYLEKRPHINLQKNIDFKNVKLQLRTRQEYRFKADGNDSSRNRIRIALKSNKSLFNIKPFISNEFFYDMDENKYSRNWLGIGFDLPESKFGKYQLYYKYISNLKDGKWENSYNIVFSLSYGF